MEPEEKSPRKKQHEILREMRRLCTEGDEAEALLEEGQIYLRASVW